MKGTIQGTRIGILILKLYATLPFHLKHVSPVSVDLQSYFYTLTYLPVIEIQIFVLGKAKWIRGKITISLVACKMSA